MLQFCNSMRQPNSSNSIFDHRWMHWTGRVGALYTMWVVSFMTKSCWPVSGRRLQVLAYSSMRMRSRDCRPIYEQERVPSSSPSASAAAPKRLVRSQKNRGIRRCFLCGVWLMASVVVEQQSRFLGDAVARSSRKMTACAIGCFCEIMIGKHSKKQTSTTTTVQ